MNKPIIITFSGKAQHGKDSSADILASYLKLMNKRVFRINYADMLKFLATKYFGWNGVKDEQGRTLLQQLGTEKIRTRYPNYWVDVVINIVNAFKDDFDYVLIPDCRFPNEIERWIEEEYTILPIHVCRSNFNNGLTEEQKNHASETALNDYRFISYLTAENMTELAFEINEKLVPLINSFFC